MSVLIRPLITTNVKFIKQFDWIFLVSEINSIPNYFHASVADILQKNQSIFDISMYDIPFVSC